MSSLSSNLCAAFLGLVIACAPPPQPHYTTHVSLETQPKRIIPVAIDKQFPSAELRQLKLAVEEWNIALNGEMRFVIYTDHFDMEPITISYIYNAKGVMLLSVSELSNPMLHIDTDVRAITSHVGVGHEIYFLKEKVSVDRMRNVALHELGHILGAMHTSSGLMRHEDDPIDHQCIDYSTARQVADYNHLNLQAMNWCQI